MGDAESQPLPSIVVEKVRWTPATKSCRRYSIVSLSTMPLVTRLVPRLEGVLRPEMNMWTCLVLTKTSDPMVLGMILVNWRWMEVANPSSSGSSCCNPTLRMGHQIADLGSLLAGRSQVGQYWHRTWTSVHLSWFQEGQRPRLVSAPRPTASAFRLELPGSSHVLSDVVDIAAELVRSILAFFQLHPRLLKVPVAPKPFVWLPVLVA